MNFFKKNKKKLIFVAFILLIITIAIVITVIIINKQDKEKDNSEDLKRAKELMSNNFLYSYLIQGEIETADGYIENEGIKYYYVDDELLNSIKTIGDINNLINDTFIEGKKEMLYEKINNGHKYIERNNNLYVAKSSDVCLNIIKYDPNDIEIENITEEKMQIRLPDQIVYAYKENDNWYLGTNNCYCLEESN